MKITYDKEVDTLYIQITEEIVDESQQQGDFIFDFDIDGDIVGIEITTASAIINKLNKTIKQ